MFTMIYVNDFPEHTGPWWTHHAPSSADWMTFVDMVFPAFLFLVGMSIPIALGSRIRKAEPLWKTLAHVLLRTISLLAIGIITWPMPRTIPIGTAKL